MTTPGTFPASALVTISTGERLLASAAAAFHALVDDGKKHGITIRPASPGAAYRDAKTQDEMRAGSMGNVALAQKWDLNPRSSVPVAAHPNGTHEHGDRIDLLFNGSSSPTQAQIDLAEKHGWHREFGANDENHFQHDGRTDIHYGVPAARRSTTVQAGEGLYAVADRTHVTYNTLVRLNPGIHPSNLAIGQKVWLS